MNDEKNLQDEKSLQEEKSNILTLILSSILFHLLLMLAIMLYRFDHEKSSDIPRVTAHDNVVLWTQPPVKTQPQTQEPKKQDEPKSKPEAKQPEFLRQLPKIMPGKQGIDKQDFEGQNIPAQVQKLSEKKEEEKPTPPKNEKIKKETTSDAPKKTVEKTYDIIRQDPTSQQTTKPPKEIENSEPEEKRSSLLEKKKEIIFDTDLDFLSKKTLHQKLIEKDQLYENVPPTQNPKIKTISYKDIGLGFSNTATNIGNSAHMMMQGTSPDIPKGDELKYITYLNQMANMIVTSMQTNSQLHLLPRARGENIICFMKVTRDGQLLDARIIRPSKHEIINIFIIESIKQVGLFNQLPKFIDKDTFEINWHILT
jgi:hypothetical protein